MFKAMESQKYLAKRANINFNISLIIPTQHKLNIENYYELTILNKQLFTIMITGVICLPYVYIEYTS